LGFLLSYYYFLLMESAKKTLTLTKYFVSLPPAKQLVAFNFAITASFGALFGWLLDIEPSFWSAITGAGSMLIAISVPSLLSAGALALFRRRVNFRRALAVSLLSTIIYCSSFLLAIVSSKFGFAHENVLIIGFGLTYLLWMFVLKFAFGLDRSSWLFAGVQLVLHTVFLIAGSSLFVSGLSDILIKIVSASFVFVAALYVFLFFASRPLKKNLGVSSQDVLSMFAGQWLYEEKDLESAFDEMGEYATTFVAAAAFRTRHGKCNFIIPYIHYGPFGNLGGSQFSHLLEKRLSKDKSTNFVFHSSATHDLNPVSSSSIEIVLDKAKQAISSAKLRPAHYSISSAKVGDSTCYLHTINDDRLISFTRHPKSTEDVNFAVGWALMERARLEDGDCAFIDCHNCETGEIDYVESGSPIAFEMLDSLQKAHSQKSLMSKMYAGWAATYPKNISAVASGGIKAFCFGDKKIINFYILIDSNGITSEARDDIVNSIKKSYEHCKVAEIFTSDTHELNAVRGVFNPCGAEDLDDLKLAVSKLCDEAYSKLSPAEFGLKKVRMRLKVLGPYQSAEIISTINSVFSIMRVAGPILLIAAILAVLILLTNL
jgi:putative membrane protein